VAVYVIMKLNSSCIELQERLQTRGVLVDLVFPIIAFKQRIKEAENLVNFLLVYYFQDDFVSFLGFYLGDIAHESLKCFSPWADLNVNVGVLQDAFGLFELYAQSVEMNDNVTKMATDMLRSLNFPAKLIKKPQGGSNNPTSLYVLVGSIRFYLLMFCLQTAPQLDVVSSAPLVNSLEIKRMGFLSTFLCSSL
jgi:hypothetical protein